MSEFQDWWTGQCSDGWGEGYEQQEIKTDEFGTIYVSFWNSSDSWQIEAEMTDTADIEEEESLDMGGISMWIKGISKNPFWEKTAMHDICFVNLPWSATARLRKVSLQLPYLSAFPYNQTGL